MDLEYLQYDITYFKTMWGIKVLLILLIRCNGLDLLFAYPFVNEIKARLLVD